MGKVPQPLGATKKLRYDVTLDTHQKKMLNRPLIGESRCARTIHSERLKIPPWNSPQQVRPVFCRLNLRDLQKNLHNERGQVSNFPYKMAGGVVHEKSQTDNLIGRYFLPRFLMFILFWAWALLACSEPDPQKRVSFCRNMQPDPQNGFTMVYLYLAAFFCCNVDTE